MTPDSLALWIVLGALATAFLLVTAVVEWAERRLREGPRGYVDTSRGTRPR
jgi:hypothetical protein